MTPEQWWTLINAGGGIAALVLVLFLCWRGDLIWKKSVEAERAANELERKASADALADARGQRDKAMDLVDELADALEARNRRDEGVRRDSR